MIHYQHGLTIATLNQYPTQSHPNMDLLVFVIRERLKAGIRYTAVQ